MGTDNTYYDMSRKAGDVLVSSWQESLDLEFALGRKPQLKGDNDGHFRLVGLSRLWFTLILTVAPSNASSCSW